MNRRRTRHRCCATVEGRVAAWCFYGLRHVLLHTTWYRETFFRRHAIRLAHVRSRPLQLPLPRSGRGRDEAVVLHRIQIPSAAASEPPGGVVMSRSPKNSCSLEKTSDVKHRTLRNATAAWFAHRADHRMGIVAPPGRETNTSTPPTRLLKQASRSQSVSALLVRRLHSTARFHTVRTMRIQRGVQQCTAA